MMLRSPGCKMKHGVVFPLLTFWIESQLLLKRHPQACRSHPG